MYFFYKIHLKKRQKTLWKHITLPIITNLMLYLWKLINQTWHVVPWSSACTLIQAWQKRFLAWFAWLHFVLFSEGYWKHNLVSKYQLHYMNNDRRQAKKMIIIIRQSEMLIYNLCLLKAWDVITSNGQNPHFKRKRI